MADDDTDEPSRPDLPEGIGPHEERELELMLAGTKPLAMFSDVVPSCYEFPDAMFEPYVQTGRIVKWETFMPCSLPGHRIRYLYFALPGEEWRIDEMHALNEAIHIRREYVPGRDETRIGQLLGYSEAEIAAFLRHVLPRRKKQIS